MKHSMKLGIALAVATGCSSGTGASGDQATIDDEVAQEAVEVASSFIPICHGGAELRAAAALQGESSSLRLLRRLRDRGYLRVEGVRASVLDPSKPDDEFGDCGGRATFPTYTHSNGTTTATVSFENFCSYNESTGNKETTNGTVSMVDHGTPSNNGPITSSFDATSPGGLTVLEQTTGGATLSNERIKFTDFTQVFGVPGGTPTSAHPDLVTMEDGQVTDLDQSKTFRQSNTSGSTYNTASGGQVNSFSGRTYLANGDFVNLSTTSPITLDANGNILGGQLNFAGAGSTSAVVTLVPGSIFQATMTVNGAPVTNVPACQP